MKPLLRLKKDRLRRMLFIKNIQRGSYQLTSVFSIYYDITERFYRQNSSEKFLISV
jgi:hypothetical protein